MREHGWRDKQVIPITYSLNPHRLQVPIGCGYQVTAQREAILRQTNESLMSGYDFVL